MRNGHLKTEKKTYIANWNIINLSAIILNLKMNWKQIINIYLKKL